MSRQDRSARPGSDRASLYDDITNKIIAELEQGRLSERTTRVIDHDQDGSMERKKREGYF